MIPFLTEILEFAAAALIVSASIPIFKKSTDIPNGNIAYVEAK